MYEIVGLEHEFRAACIGLIALINSNSPSIGPPTDKGNWDVLQPNSIFKVVFCCDKLLKLGV